jgi:hypothetical protein
MLLESTAFVETVNHFFFAANDSLSAECGVRHLRALGLPLRAVSGAMTQSALNICEAEQATGIACLSNEMILAGKALELLPEKQTPMFAEMLRMSQFNLQTA